MDQHLQQTVRHDEAPDGSAALAATLDLITLLPMRACSLAAVAERSGLDLADLEREHGSFDDLARRAIDTWRAERLRSVRRASVDRGAVALVRALVEEYTERTPLARLLVTLYEIASTPSHPLAARLQQGREGLLLLVEDALRQDAARGDERVEIDPTQAAIQLVAVYEGLQVRSLREPPAAVLAAFDRMVATARWTWRNGPTAPGRR